VAVKERAKFYFLRFPDRCTGVILTDKTCRLVTVKVPRLGELPTLYNPLVPLSMWTRTYVCNLHYKTDNFFNVRNFTKFYWKFYFLRNTYCTKKWHWYFNDHVGLWNSWLLLQATIWMFAKYSWGFSEAINRSNIASDVMALTFFSYENWRENKINYSKATTKGVETKCTM
jgi:hypothetical protein